MSENHHRRVNQLGFGDIIMPNRTWVRVTGRVTEMPGHGPDTPMYSVPVTDLHGNARTITVHSHDVLCPPDGTTPRAWRPAGIHAAARKAREEAASLTARAERMEKLAVMLGS